MAARRSGRSAGGRERPRCSNLYSSSRSPGSVTAARRSSSRRTGRGTLLPRGHTVGELVLRSDGERVALAVVEPTDRTADGKWKPTVLMERVSRYLEEMPDAVTLRAILDGVEGKSTQLREAIDRLVEGGYVQRTPGANRAHWHTSAKPYRAYHDEYDPFADAPEHAESRRRRRGLVTTTEVHLVGVWTILSAKPSARNSRPSRNSPPGGSTFPARPTTSRRRRTRPFARQARRASRPADAKRTPPVPRRRTRRVGDLRPCV